MFATHQEEVRKDIEQAFGQIVKYLTFCQDQSGFEKKR